MDLFNLTKYKVNSNSSHSLPTYVIIFYYLLYAINYKWLFFVLESEYSLSFSDLPSCIISFLFKWIFFCCYNCYFSIIVLSIGACLKISLFIFCYSKKLVSLGIAVLYWFFFFFLPCWTYYFKVSWVRFSFEKSSNCYPILGYLHSFLWWFGVLFFVFVFIQFYS